MAGFLNQQITDRWAIYCGDSMDMLAGLPDASIHGVVYSPPFGGLYHYSSDDRDLSNAPDYAAFWDQYDYFIAELKRVTVPGRTHAVHASLVPSGNSGRDSYTDFPGDVIRAHQKHGFDFIARHVIWRRYASSVWDDIRLSRTLPFQPDIDGGDEDDAEKHVHPLQLDVIERWLDLRTKPGERVLTPFMGVGSEVFAAVRMGRFGIGCELKPNYFDQAVQNLKHVDDLDDTPSDDQLSIWTALEVEESVSA